jgi:3-oxoacyl-[acyl-carrier-protein] synthase II
VFVWQPRGRRLICLGAVSSVAERTMLFPPTQRLREPSRVVVTGAGVITALGAGWAVNAEGFRTGRIGIGPVTLFDVSRQRVKVAGQVAIPELPDTRLTTAERRRMDRAGRLLLAAGIEAWTGSGWYPTDDVPLVLGTTSGGMGLGEAYFRQAMERPFSGRSQPTRISQYMPQSQALDLARALGFRGPVTLIANACASGANAVGHAFELVRSGRAERALAGGYDALSQLVFAGFDSLQALSPTTCRPFDAGRDGLALGEGAAVVALETLESAVRRGAPILGEIVGYGAATDVHHLTQPHPQGEAAVRTMSAACRQAGLGPEVIGYVNAHGTGTSLNDASEAAAIMRWAGARAAGLPVSSTKAGIGHLLGAAGAVEVVVCLMALGGGWLPPQRDLGAADAACGFPLVREPVASDMEFALTNSFGFGGANASLVLRRWR